MDNLREALRSLDFLELVKDTEYIIMTNNYYISVDIPSRTMTVEHYDIDRNVKYSIPKYIDISEEKLFIKAILDQENSYSILKRNIEISYSYTQTNDDGSYTKTNNGSYTQTMW